MKHPKNLGDKRETTMCVFCSNGTETRDHVPSRVFLDAPYPEDLPVIGACSICNNGFSLDEEYVACLIECACVGGVESSIPKRDKVEQALAHKPALRDKLRKAVSVGGDGSISFTMETERIERVLLKLARGHLMFEQNKAFFGDPISLNFATLEQLDETSRHMFEDVPMQNFLPEVGSRAMQRMFEVGGMAGSPWIEVQPLRYRYMTTQSGLVRIVINEYLCCEVQW